jgi:hypothetical protein
MLHQAAGAFFGGLLRFGGGGLRSVMAQSHAKISTQMH